MSLTKSYQTKIIRATYEVNVFNGADVRSLKDDLAGVPEKAILVDSWDDERGGVCMKFMLETEDEK